MAFNATTLLSVLLAATAQLHALPQGEDHGTAPAPLPLLSGNNATDWPQFRVSGPASRDDVGCAAARFACPAPQSSGPPLGPVLPHGTQRRARLPPPAQVIRDLETLWEVPDQVGGVLLVAHGCSHQAGDFWPASQRCPGCLGLPEEMAIRATALRRGYAVIAVSSYNRSSGCWHNTQASRSEDLQVGRGPGGGGRRAGTLWAPPCRGPAALADAAAGLDCAHPPAPPPLQRLPDIVREVVREEGLEGLPLFLFGASSGGGIVLRLAAIMAEVQVRAWVAAGAWGGGWGRPQHRSPLLCAGGRSEGGRPLPRTTCRVCAAIPTPAASRHLAWRAGRGGAGGALPPRPDGGGPGLAPLPAGGGGAHGGAGPGVGGAGGGDDGLLQVLCGCGLRRTLAPAWQWQHAPGGHSIKTACPAPAAPSLFGPQRRRYVRAVLHRPRAPAAWRRSVGIPAAEIRIDPQPITPQFLQRAPQIDRATAEAMVEALDGEGLLDEVRPRAAATTLPAPPAPARLPVPARMASGAEHGCCC